MKHRGQQNLPNYHLQQLASDFSFSIIVLDLYILIISGLFKGNKCFVVYDICLLDFYYGEECLPARVGQIEIKLHRDFDKPRINFV